MCFSVTDWVCVCVCVRHWSWLQSVRRQSRVIDWSSAEWPETRRTYAELFLQIKQQHYYSGPHMSYVIQTAMHERAGAAWHSDSLRGHAAVTCCKNTWKEERVGKAYRKGARHEGSIDNRWLIQDFPVLWEQWGHTSFGGVKTATGAGERAECGQFKHFARTRMVRSAPSLLFLPPRHTHSPFPLSSTSSSGFNPFKEGLGRTRESQLHTDTHQREGKKERK